MTCEHTSAPTIPRPNAAWLADTAALFAAMADPERLRLLLHLADGERCVSELALIEQQKLGTVSARLKLLFGLRLVARRREGRHIYYRLDDAHVVGMIQDALAHAAERQRPTDDANTTSSSAKEASI